MFLNLLKKTLFLFLFIPFIAQAEFDPEYELMRTSIIEDPSAAEEGIQLYLDKSIASQETNRVAKACYLLGELYYIQSEPLQAAEAYKKSLELCQVTNNKDLKALVHTGLGSTFLVIQDYEQSQLYFNKSLRYYKDIQDTLGQAFTIFNIANLKANTGNIDSALWYYSLSENYFEDLNDIGTLSRIHLMTGYLLFDEGKQKEGLLKIRKSLRMSLEISDVLASQSAYFSLAHMKKESDLDSAKYFLFQAELLSEEIVNPAIQLEIHEELADIYTQQDSLEMANHHLMIVTSLKDSVVSAGEVSQIQKMDFEEAPAVLVKSDTDKSAQYMWFWMLVLATLILPAALIVVRIRVRREDDPEMIKELEAKNREILADKLKLTSQKELIDKIEKELKELHVAGGTGNLQQLVSDIKSSQQSSNWEEFEMSFSRVHADFYLNLEDSFPGLTPNERKLCGLLLLNLSSKEISEITQKSVRSIEVARYRLRKKMGLSKEQKLVGVLNSVSQGKPLSPAS